MILELYTIQIYFIYSYLDVIECIPKNVREMEVYKMCNNERFGLASFISTLGTYTKDMKVYQELCYMILYAFPKDKLNNMPNMIYTMYTRFKEFKLLLQCWKDIEEEEV